MSVTGIASTILTGLNAYQHRGQSKVQQLASEFQQLAQDVQSGNLTQAQQDFTTLAQNIPGVSLASGTQSVGATSAAGTTTTGVTSPVTGAPSSTNPLIQEFNQLGQDLQSGNLQGAQQDITNIQNTAQQNVQANVQQSGHHRHHHHRVESDQNSSQSASSSGSSSSSSSSSGYSTSSLSQLTGSLDQAFGQLAQSLQSGNIQGAQQAFSVLQNDLQQIGGFISSGSGSSSGATSASAAAGSLNVTA